MTVQLENVTIRYGEFVAVDDLSVTFEQGSVGLLGRNGAGKSSVLKSLLGLVRPAAGTMRFRDLPPDASPAEIRGHVGYMPERDAHLPQASAFEMVSLLGMLSGLPRRDAWRRAHEVLYLVGLEEQRYRPVSGYSAGMRQKAKLASALVHDPQVLFLDEPTNGLDPAGRREMLGLVRQLSRDLGKSVVFSTHILQDVEAVCDSAVVMERGRVAAQGELHELTAGADRQFRLRVDPTATNVLAVLAERWRAESLGDGHYAVWLPEDAPTNGVFEAVRGAGARVRSFTLKRRSLEEVFLSAVRERPAASNAGAHSGGAAAPDVANATAADATAAVSTATNPTAADADAASRDPERPGAVDDHEADR
jgi:ABC-2 type transport system ATP-binding protein